MASKDTRLNIEITAEDKASDTIRDVKSDVDDLDKADATVDVNAKDDASRVLADVDSGARDLDGTKATVTADADDNASRILDDVDQSRKDLDGARAKVAVDLDDNASRKLDELQTKLRDLDGQTSRIGTAGAAAAGGAAGAITGGLFGDLTSAITGAGELAIKTQQVADATGAPLDKASRLVTVWQQNGLEVEDLLDIIGQVNQVLQQTPDLKRQLNIGGAKDLIDQLLLAVEGINTAFDTAGSRQNIASQLFGEEGVRQIGLVETRSGNIRDAMQKVSDTQLIDPADVERSRELNANVQEFNQHLREAQLILAEDVLPLVNSIADKIGEWTSKARDFANWISGPDISGTDILHALVNGSNTSDGPGPPGQRGQGVFEPTFTAPRGAPAGGGHPTVIVNNPPGTPATVVEADRIYTRRNDVRYS